MYDGGHWMGYGGGFMWLFWIILIGVVVWIVKSIVGGNNKAGNEQKSPLEILEARFAKGEIDEEEFERKRKLIKG